MALYKYACDQVTITFDATSLGLGTHTSEGHAEGTFVRVARRTPINSLRVSADAGRVSTRSKRRDPSGTITITYEEGSPTLAWIADVIAVDEEGEREAIIAVQVKDSSGNDRAGAAQAWFVNRPDIEKALTSGTREVVLETHNLRTEARGSSLA